MTTKQRARAAAVPLGRLNLGSIGGMREFRRRMRAKAAELGNSWYHQTQRPVGKPRCLKNTLGWKQRWRWVPKG